MSAKYGIRKTLQFNAWDQAHATNLDPAGVAGPERYLHLAHDVSATFARASTAYLPDGSQVAAGQPRYWGGGILLEEGLTNEHPNPSVENDLTKWSASYHCTLTRDNTRAWHGTWSGKFVVTAPGGNFYGNTAGDGAGGIPCLGGQARTHSFYIWAQPGNVGTAKIEVNQFGADGTHISGSGVASVFSSVQGQWERLSVSFITHAEARFLTLRIRGHNDCVEGDTFWVDACMSIPSSYNLSFHDASRAIESLVLPCPVGLTPAGGRLAVDVEIGPMVKRQIAGQYPEIFCLDRGIGGLGLYLCHKPTAAQWWLGSVDDTGAESGANIPDAAIPDGARRLWCVVDGAAKVVRLYCDADPTPIAVINDAKLPSALGDVSLGGRSDTTMANVPFYAARMDSIPRGAGDLSGAGTPLEIDDHTLALYLFNGDLENKAHHVASGSYVALLDSGTPRTIWRDLRLSGENLGTVTIQSRITDDGENWTALVAGIAGGAGRYLEVTMTLASQESGAISPTVTGLTVDYLIPARSLPMPLQEFDQELALLCEVLGEGLADVAPGDTLDGLLSVSGMSDAQVARWLAVLGWRQMWRTDKRRLLKALLTLYRLGGTVQGLIVGVEFFIGLDVVRVQEDWPEAYPSPMTDEEKCALTVYMSNYPYGEDTLAMVPFAQQVVDLLKPAHAHATATVHRNRVQDIGHIPINDSRIYRKTIRYVTHLPL